MRDLGERGGIKRKDAAFEIRQSQINTGTAFASWVASGKDSHLSGPWVPRLEATWQKWGQVNGLRGKHVAHTGSATEGAPQPSGPASIAWRRGLGNLSSAPGMFKGAFSAPALLFTPGSRGSGSTVPKSGQGPCRCSPGAEVSQQPGFWAPPRLGEWLPSRQRGESWQARQCVSRQLPGLPGRAGAEGQGAGLR